MRKQMLWFVGSCLMSNLKAQLINTGSFKVFANTNVVVLNDLKNRGLFMNHGTLRSSSSIVNQNAATYTGTGSISGALLTNQGTVSPGTLVGCLSFANGYTNTETLQIEFGGTTVCTDADQLNVTGTATLGGNLHVSLLNGYLGTANDRITILSATTLVGTFAAVTLPTNWFLNYNKPTIGQVTLSYNSVLPIELLRFTAIRVQKEVHIHWETASEKQNHHFEVERSIEGTSFTTIGTVKGGGNSSIPQKYVFFDPTPVAGINYYRLRQVDTDGKSTLSTIVSVEMPNSTKPFTIQPNPMNDYLRVAATFEGDYTVEVFNMVGQLIQSYPIAQSVSQFATHDLPKGVYLISIQSKERVQLFKVVKQ